MRDFRDAKSMAHTLREALAAKQYKITVGESLELIARLFGMADWNTLSALIKEWERGAKANGARGAAGGLGFTAAAEASLHRALRAASERGQAEATVQHLLLSLTRDPDATAIMEECAVDLAAIRQLLSSSVELGSAGEGSGGASEPVPSSGFQRVVQRAILEVQFSGRRNITGADLLVALVTEPDGTSVRLLRERASDLSEALKKAGPRTG